MQADDNGIRDGVHTQTFQNDDRTRVKVQRDMSSGAVNTTMSAARVQDDGAVKVLAPAASDPIAALIAECSLSTGTNSVSISPIAKNVETICGISVDGVIGNAGITSGFTCLIA